MPRRCMRRRFGDSTAQEIHQVIVHLLCAAVDREVLASPVIPSAEELSVEESSR